MLNISLEIHDANKDAEARARAVVALLHNIFGDAVLPYPVASKRVGEIEIKGPVDVIFPKEEMRSASPEMIASFERLNSPASDGYPTEDEEPNAAAAFGAPAVTPAPASERDKDGIPWDERIHASTKTTNKDGTWTRRRNTPDETFNAVMSELKGANTERTLAAAASMVPTPPAPAVAPQVPLPPVPAPPTASPAPSPTPAAPSASSTAPADNVPPFPAVMVEVTKLQHDQKLTKPDLDGLLAAVGIPPAVNGTYSILGLSKNPELIPAFRALLVDHVAAQG